MTISDKFYALGVQVKGNRTEQKCKCPNCVTVGKTNINDTCLSINLNTGLYNCHKCGWKGCVAESNYKPEEMQIVYKIPTKPNITKLSDEALKFFESRGINQEVVLNNKIASTSDGNGVLFPYFRNGQLINYKTRLLKEKRFFQAKEAEPIMYNLDRITGQKEIIVCEGEFDALSFEVAGFTNHTSVNQGAPNENDANVDKKLECITNCYDVFENAETIYLAVDTDNNGIRLQKELIRRFGAEKCKIVDFNDCKDANEYLIKHGAFELVQLIKIAKDVKIEGIFNLEENLDSMLNGFRNGYARGQTTYIHEVDQAWKWRKGEVTLWTGYQNEGKSLLLNQLSVIKSYFDKDKFAVFSPENMPMDDFFNDLIEMLVGKTSDPYFGKLQMSEIEYLNASSFLNRHFFLVYPDFDFKIDTIFEKVKYLVRKQGIEHLIIDPYNTIEHMLRGGEREDLYISRFMAKLKRFAVENDISIQLVAHQITARPNDKDGGRYHKPNLNNIKGGGTFADKADNVVYVWRPNRALDFRCTQVMFGSQKIKKQKLVARPCDVDNIDFDFKANRYLFNGQTPFKEIDKQRGILKTVEELPEAKPLIIAMPNEAFDNNLNIEEDENDVPF
jgi:twinkle protein